MKRKNKNVGVVMPLLKEHINTRVFFNIAKVICLSNESRLNFWHFFKVFFKSKGRYLSPILMLLLFVFFYSSSPLLAQAEKLENSESEAQETAKTPEALKGPLPKTILLVVPQEGPLAKFGEQAQRGAELALKAWGGGFNLEVRNESAETFEEIDYTKVALIMGYFTESAFQRDAPRYLYLKKPVLLNYLTNPEAAARGPNSFFRLMPSYSEQGAFMAMEVLKMKKRPSRILIIQADSQNNIELVESFKKTLAEPNQAKVSETQGKRQAKESVRIRPLDSRSQIVSIDSITALNIDSVDDFGKRNPDLIIIAVDFLDALNLAPMLADSKMANAVPIWGGTSLAFREIGGAYASLKLKMSLCLPVISLVQTLPKNLVDFKNSYISNWRAQPSWIAALSYDATNIAIKAAASLEEGGDVQGFLSKQSHHSLGDYDLSPGVSGSSLPMGIMPVRLETLGFLP